MNFDDRIKLSAFDCETTNKNDYRVPSIEPYIKYRWPCERAERNVQPPPRPREYTCPETMTKMRPTEYIPSNLLWTQRPIIDPPLEFCDVSKREDPHKEDVIRTRPRVYMGSAVSIDDVPEPEIRNMLLNYMYTTDFKRSMMETQEYVRDEATKIKPKPEMCDSVPKMTPRCPLKDEGVRKEVPMYIPKLEGKYRKQFESWDQRQLRATVDPTVLFWKKHYEQRNPIHDKPAADLIPSETVDRLTYLIETNKLRIPHDKVMGGYDGYVPEVADMGVEKVELPNEHPMHTTYETVYVNHFDHVNNNFEK